MALEVELKYLAADADPLARLMRLPALGPATLGAAAMVEEVDRYLDTHDGRFAASRWACRLRRRGGASRLSLKGPAAEATGGSLHRRPELEAPATDTPDPATWPPSEARQLVDDLREGRPLVERCRLVQSRAERPVLVDGSRLGTLSVDTVRVETEGIAHGTLHAVELELVADATTAHEALLEELDAALATVDGLLPDDRTKLEHALDLIAAR